MVCLKKAMNPALACNLVIVGLSGFIAQVLLLRGLLVVFYGNELTVGVILANWLVVQGCGAYVFGRIADKTRDPRRLFAVLQAVFVLSLCASLCLARGARHLAGIPFGEAVSFTQIFFLSAIVVAPAGFCHGALFSVSCVLAGSVGRAYLVATLGAIAGGFIFTFLFLPLVHPFGIVFLVSFAIISAVLFLVRGRWRVFAAAGLGLVAALGAAGVPGKLDDMSLRYQWQGIRLLEARDSPYGNIAAAQLGDQRTFFYDGIPVITVPYPDMAAVQEFAHIPLLSHPAPHDVLVLGSGAGGLINEILKHDVRAVDYVELDSALIDMIKKYPSGLTESELNDPRVRVVYTDCRAFIRAAGPRYDVIFVGIGEPGGLSANRLLTQEFFSLAAKRLSSGGILAFCLTGSADYISPQLRDLNASVHGALARAFAYTAAVPGDCNLYLASDTVDNIRLDPSVLYSRLQQRRIIAPLLTKSMLEYRLDPGRLQWLRDSLRDGRGRVNRDDTPFAVFAHLVLWNKQFSESSTRLFASFQNMRLSVLCAGLSILALLLFIGARRARRFPSAALVYTLGTTGFFGMLASLVLILAFQVFYGSLYYALGILIGIFMAGAAFGSFVMVRRRRGGSLALAMLVRCEMLALLFSLFLAVCAHQALGYGIFALAFFIAGSLTGAEFPLAAQLYMNGKPPVGRAAGVLNLADLAGGWLAGTFGGMILLPVIGLGGSCVLLAFVKLGSLVMLKQYLTKPPI